MEDMKQLQVKILYSEVLKTYGVVYAHNHLKALRGSYESVDACCLAIDAANKGKRKREKLILID